MKFVNKILSRVDERTRSLRPDRIASRFTEGPVIVANSVPKGGTHLLTKCLSNFPHISYSHLHYVKGTPHLDEVEKALKRTGRNRFMAAHLWWSEECAHLLASHGAKCITMLRDPRAICVSGAFFIMRRADHHLHDYMASLPDDESRIAAYIRGIDASHSTLGQERADIGTAYARYTAWNREDLNILVLFEDLIGSKGGGDDARQLAQIGRIAEHLDIELDDAQARTIAERTFSSKSVTFRKGSISEWRNHFTEGLKAEFRAVAGDLLVELGYEDGEW
jgi:hypothetical protein